MTTPNTEPVASTILIALVAQRYVGIMADLAPDLPQPSRLETMMTIDFVHEICPLDLLGLSDASKGDLVHDVGGMIQHYDHDARKLTDCFQPRYAITLPRGAEL